ncbi:MAG TPA: histidine kinase, partial [Candidatus Sutterella merdavium]|nr:histidine kinase [Candidatus Sutterella merdavium]
MPLTKAITLDFLKRFFGISRTRSLTARTLSSVILRNLRLFPVAIAAQIIGMGSLVLMYWETEYSRVFLIAWTLIWLAQVIVALVFVRKFWRDDARV